MDGPVAVEHMKKAGQHFGTEYRHGTVSETDLSKRPIRLLIDDEWEEPVLCDRRMDP